jgi:hypothetical protein
MALVLLWVWHILLLRLFLDKPLVVAGWLAAVLGLAIVARGLARAVSPDRRRWSERLWKKLDGAGLAFLVFFLFLLFLFHWGYGHVMSDGREYFALVRTVVIDRNLYFRDERASVYPFGGPVLWVPFFLLCHLWLALLNRFGGIFSADGYSIPYQIAVGLGSLAYGCVGLGLVYRVLTDYFSRLLATFTVLVLCCGSFLVWYLVVESSMVHAMSMFATTLFLYVWHRTRRGRTRVQWAWLGASAGLMAMVRWQDVLFLVVPALDGLAQSWRSRTSPRVPGVIADGSIFGACALLACSPQLLFWRLVRGAWVSPPAAEHGVNLASSLHMADALFSPNHGLVSWTPLVYLALVGLPLFFRRDRMLFTVLMVGFLAQVYVNGTLDVGWGGSGFGARRFADCALAFAVGLASLLEWARRHPAVAPGSVVGVLVIVNTMFMLDVRIGRLPSGEGVTFQSILGSLYDRVGNPFSFPQNAIVAWRYHVGWAFYDREKGRTYNNVSIDVGEPDDELFLGTGWSDRERAPGFSFRWATGLQSTVLVSLKTADDYQLELQCGPFAYAGASTLQTVEVSVNDTGVGQIVMDKGMSLYQIQLPVRVLHIDLNELRFRYRYAVAPASIGISRDPRPLAIQCHALRLTRLFAHGLG